MKQIQVLDCTLRDGGRVIDCAFRDDQIAGVIKRLMQAEIDIIEVGFLRNHLEYHGNSTFFGTVEQVERFLPSGTQQQFTLFVDHGMFEIDKLAPRRQGLQLGIRYGFTKNDFLQSRDAIKREMMQIKEKGYRLYFQSVNTAGYTDKELLEIIALANEVVPYSFGLVDTYGAMYEEDLERLFSLVNFNLNKNVLIDFHGHNNSQLAFALAQKAAKLCQGQRKLIIDATLDGMGKCAGNLNTELIANYLNQKYKQDYGFDYLLDAIDEYIELFKQEKFWGYSIPAFMAGIYKSHPNNVIYLTNKFRLSTKDIRKMLALIDEDKRQRYDYDNIQRIYKNYFSHDFKDDETVERLKLSFTGKTALIIAPGNSLNAHAESVRKFIQQESPIAISVNFVYDLAQYLFFGNDRRYQKLAKVPDGYKVMLTSNVRQRTGEELVFNYMNYIAESGNYFDNSSLMLLNLLQRLSVKRICIAGVDGFSSAITNYCDDSDMDIRCAEQFEEVNRELEQHLYRFAQRNQGRINIRFITPSRFENAVKEGTG